MDIREKMIEILRKPIFPHELVDPIEAVADYLLDSGVTVQEWISVKDRLPEPKELVLCIWKDINGIHYGFARYQHDNVWYVSNEGMPEVTHWMSLPKKPQPQKGYSNG